MVQLPPVRTYFSILGRSLLLTIKNIHAFILITIYSLIFYLGYFFYLEKDYMAAVLLFLVFTACISSIFYITGQIVKHGRLPLSGIIKSFKAYYVRGNFILAFWFLIYLIMIQFIVTPISAVPLSKEFIMYFVQIPAVLLVFIVFNTLPEATYYSDDNVESIVTSSLKFIEKHWAAWILPNIIIMLLLNLLDHRLSIMPTLGLDPKTNTSADMMAKMQDIAFYARSFVFTAALIFRGLLYSTLLESKKIK